jgi:hypothetical protein
MLAHPTNLVATLNGLAGAFFIQQPVPPVLCEETATLIVSRQQKTGTNAGFFIPFTAEAGAEVMLFSGEKLHTDFARNHAMMIEAARLLKLLAVENHGSPHAVQLAYHRMQEACYSSFCTRGECKALTMAFLRFLLVEGGEGTTALLEEFLTRLSSHRDGKGKWKGFPFYFTLLVLTEIPDPFSTSELLNSASACEKLRSLNLDPDPVSKRRLEILTRALERS